ncbi:hypothetical protein [Calycomorphotria hydatis]|uniref:Uncharacterized protein n=1 Tax=Calycomorphotria hydatis TaxID=2528027 RepID=A0A517TDG3_9PLAN|nr:hypothetical protein [Calycomorphotria hydatis]QDT66414.1 hypothetical protein V22_36810 [Calycomorphotria hydatis]
MSQLAGVVQSLILIAPIVAVPALAMLGPQTTSGEQNASPLDDIELEDSFLEPPAEVSVDSAGQMAATEVAPAEQAAEPKPADPRWDFELTNARSETEKASADALLSNSAKTISVSETASSEPNKNDLFASLDSAFGKSPSTSSDRSGAKAQPPLDWDSAIARLRAFGIDDYYLTSGSNSGEFYFSCRMQQRDSQLIRRFEAEADEPLLAVTDVISQLEDWSKRR